MTSEQFESIYNQIKQASKSNQLVVFIGAGMSNNFGFPTWNELVRKMYYALMGKEREEEQPFSSDELIRIPQALRLKDETQYEKILKDSFGAHRVTTSDNAMLDEQNMEDLVLCEDDYLSYSESHILMENFIKSLLINHTFLFIGYGVGDSNLKMIMKWVDNILSRQKGGEIKRRKHILFYTESFKMEELQKMYLEQK